MRSSMTTAWVVGLVWSLPSMAADEGDVIVGRPVTDRSGEPARLEDRAATMIILNVWASWCGPCREELPRLEALHGRLAPIGADVVALNVDRGLARGVAMADHLELDMPVLFDPAGKMAAWLEPPSMPTTYLLDADRRIVAVYPGSLDDAAVRKIESDVRAKLAAGSP